MRRISSTVAWVSVTLMPAVGSSRQRSFGSVASAMPISRLRCSPWERLAASSSSLSPSPTDVQHGAGAVEHVGERAVVAQEAPGVAARLGGDAHVLEHGGAGQDVGDLVRARERPCWEIAVRRQPGDVLAVEDDAPARRAAARRSGS